MQDYRDISDGPYDAVCSIEMIEAVGERYWPNYFGAIRDRLKTGGSALLQVITIADDRYGDYSRAPDFIQRYIFPGGELLHLYLTPFDDRFHFELVERRG